MKAFRYILADYSDRPRPKYDVCPGCGKREFIPYLDTQTGEVLADGSGKCERVTQCGWHKRGWQDEQPATRKPEREPPGPNMIPQTEVAPTLERMIANNTLAAALFAMRIKITRIKEVFNRYKVGTWKHGECVFWLHDFAGICRSGKIMRYNENAGRTGKPNWAHIVLNLEKFDLKPTLFGEHLLADNKTATVGLVESEKTALMLSMFPNWLTDDDGAPYIWVSVGGLQNFTEGASRRLWTLNGRKVDVYPDLNAIESWGDCMGPLRESIGFKGKVVEWWECDGVPELLETVTDAHKADPADVILARIKQTLAR